MPGPNSRSRTAKGGLFPADRPAGGGPPADRRTQIKKPRALAHAAFFRREVLLFTSILYSGQREISTTRRIQTVTNSVPGSKTIITNRCRSERKKNRTASGQPKEGPLMPEGRPEAPRRLVRDGSRRCVRRRTVPPLRGQRERGTLEKPAIEPHFPPKDLTKRRSSCIINERTQIPHIHSYKRLHPIEQEVSIWKA